MKENDPRKREIDHLGERLADPNLSDAAFESFLSERAKLIREEAEEMGILLDSNEEF